METSTDITAAHETEAAQATTESERLILMKSTLEPAEPTFDPTLQYLFNATKKIANRNGLKYWQIVLSRYEPTPEENPPVRSTIISFKKRLHIQLNARLNLPEEAWLVSIELELISIGVRVGEPGEEPVQGATEGSTVESGIDLFADIPMELSAIELVMAGCGWLIGFPGDLATNDCATLYEMIFSLPPSEPLPGDHAFRWYDQPQETAILTGKPITILTLLADLNVEATLEEILQWNEDDQSFALEWLTAKSIERERNIRILGLEPPRFLGDWWQQRTMTTQQSDSQTETSPAPARSTPSEDALPSDTISTEDPPHA